MSSGKGIELTTFLRGNLINFGGNVACHPKALISFEPQWGLYRISTAFGH